MSEEVKEADTSAEMGEEVETGGVETEGVETEGVETGGVETGGVETEGGETEGGEKTPDETASTPTGKLNWKPRPRYFPYRRNQPPFRGGYSHPPSFRTPYPMHRPYRMWSPRPPRPQVMPPPQQAPYPEPTDAAPQPEPQSALHWSQHVENAIFRPCFDWLECSEAFPRVNPEIDDAALNESLSTRGAELLPTGAEAKAVQELVEKVLGAAGKIAAGEDEADTEVKVDEAILVGSFKKKTYTKGAMSADVVILLKELPIEARVDRLSKRLMEQLKVVSEEDLAKARQELEARIEVLKEPIAEEEKEEKGEEKSLESQEKERVRELSSSQLKLKNFPKEPIYSFTSNKLTASTFLIISSTGASAKIFSTTEANLIKQDDDSEDKIDLSIFQFSLQMVRHAKWFETECGGDAIPCLVRVLKDMKKRFPAWKHFHPWLMDLVAHKAVKGKGSEQREIGLAFRYVLQLISGGCFLPGFYGLEDPCEKQSPPAHYSLKDDAKDEITLSGQILLRMLQNGAYREIIGGQGIQVLDLNRPFSVGGIQFAMPQKAFEVVSEENGSAVAVES